jgi:hypothetical protein
MIFLKVLKLDKAKAFTLRRDFCYLNNYEKNFKQNWPLFN